MRLEAWAKSINRPRQSDKRLERSRQKVRVTAKPNASEIPVRPDFDNRMTQLKATMSQLQTNLQRLSEKATPATNVTVTSRAPVGLPSGRRQKTQTTVSARKVPRQNGRGNQYTQTYHHLSRHFLLLNHFYAGNVVFLDT